MYQQLDERLSALEPGGGSGGDAAAGSDNTAQHKPGADKAYKATFDKLRNGKYNDAISGFEDFVKKYPNSTKTADALYWLGQARYVQGDLSGASDALQKMVDAYPKNPNIASALLRIGVIKQTVGKKEQAQATFQRILKDYPDSNAAGKAREKLQ